MNKGTIKKYTITFVLIILGFLLQTTVIQSIKIADISPNLVLVLVVFIAYINGVYTGMISGILFGLLMDFQYGSLIGIYMLIFLLIGYFCGQLSRVFYKGDYIVPLSMVCASDLLYSLIVFLTDYLLRGRLNVKYYFGSIMFPELIYTLVISVFTYGVICFLYKDNDQKGDNIL